MPSNIYTARFLNQYPGPNLRFLKISATQLLQYLNCYENRKFPVVPVLLSGAEVTSGFLFLNARIDLRNTPPGSEATDQLLAGVQGTDAQVSRRRFVRIVDCDLFVRKTQSCTLGGRGAFFAKIGRENHSAGRYRDSGSIGNR